MIANKMNNFNSLEHRMVGQKPKTYRNPKYLEYIRTLPCCVCRRSGVAPHHADTGGMGLKCNDTRTVPLCYKHHMECHALGRITFQEAYNICFISIQIKCLEDYINVPL